MLEHQLGDGMTGVETVQALWQRHGALPARIVTANRSAEVRQLCAEAGIAMMTKPIDPRALESLLMRLGD